MGTRIPREITVGSFQREKPSTELFLSFSEADMFDFPEPICCRTMESSPQFIIRSKSRKFPGCSNMSKIWRSAFVGFSRSKGCHFKSFSFF